MDLRFTDGGAIFITIKCESCLSEYEVAIKKKFDNVPQDFIEFAEICCVFCGSQIDL